MPYGTASPEATAEYERRQAALAEEVKTCSACKAAATRKANAAARLATWATDGFRGIPEFELRKAQRAARKPEVCGHHREQSRLNYVCSPVSETYWCS